MADGIPKGEEAPTLCSSSGSDSKGPVPRGTWPVSGEVSLALAQQLCW